MFLVGRLLGTLSVGFMALGASGVSGQNYPSKPIRIVTAEPGGVVDFTSRLIATAISGPLGQPVIIDNRPTLITTEVVAKASPDGYTLLVQGASVWITPLLQKMPYDVVADLSPITLIDRQALIVAVHPSVPAKSVKELITLAKARPGELNYGSGFAAGPSFLAAELFKSIAGVNIQRVPYKSNALSITGLISGEVQFLILNIGLLMPHAKSGKLRALAVTSLEPSLVVPGLPTVAASGLPGYEMVGMGGMWAPAKTPQAIVNRVYQETVGFLKTSEAKEKFFNSGSEVNGSSPVQFAATIKSEITKWGKVLKDAGIKSDQ